MKFFRQTKNSLQRLLNLCRLLQAISSLLWYRILTLLSRPYSSFKNYHIENIDCSVVVKVGEFPLFICKSFLFYEIFLKGNNISNVKLSVKIQISCYRFKSYKFQIPFICISLCFCIFVTINNTVAVKCTYRLISKGKVFNHSDA